MSLQRGGGGGGDTPCKPYLKTGMFNLGNSIWSSNYCVESQSRGSNDYYNLGEVQNSLNNCHLDEYDRQSETLEVGIPILKEYISTNYPSKIRAEEEEEEGNDKAIPTLKEYISSDYPSKTRAEEESWIHESTKVPTSVGETDALLPDLHYGPASPRGKMAASNLEYLLNCSSSGSFGTSTSNSGNQYECNYPSTDNAYWSNYHYNLRTYYMNQYSPASYVEFLLSVSFPNSQPNSNILLNHQGMDLPSMPAVTSDSLLDLMTDQNGSYTFKMLISICNQPQLGLIVQKLTLDHQKLIHAALTNKGSRSLQELIKKLKKLNLAMSITRVLSSQIYDLMTDEFGRHVIQQCFNYLDCNENEVLYEAVIEHCLELATHQLGCISLNGCIDTLKGPLRDRLLNLISDHSLLLSGDPIGTYVIQHVLLLHNPKFSDKICEILKGNYARLSQVHHGSHLIEKCLKSSNLGLVHLIDEIRNRPGMLEILAQHQFGNYVIQQALKISLENRSSYHVYLVAALLPHVSRFEQNKYGKRLAGLLRVLAH